MSRRSLVLALVPLVPVVLCSLALPAVGRADPWPPAAERADGQKSSLQVSIDREKVDLPGHRLEVKLSHTADKVRIKVVGQSGAMLAEVEKSFTGTAAGTVLVMTWTPSSEEPVAKIEVWGYDTDGFYSGVAITPWNVNIDHEQVNFETDSDVIRPSEAPKLEQSLQKIGEVLKTYAGLGKITLFVKGHTDTVGSTDHNIVLSRKRARAIASWFRAHGLKAPVAFEGLGKSGLHVKTADQVDEPKNRVVDYILGLEPPPLPTSGDFSWKTP
jgi:outer membrane protein OmpA-like peptidoglycan-associated protein